MKIQKIILVITLLFSASTIFAIVPVQSSKSLTDINPTTHWSPTDEDSVVFLEDWESGLGDWVTVDVTAAGLTWHTDTFNAYSGNSWWCGDPVIGGYNNHWLQYLISPSIDLSDATNPVLSFMLNYNVEDPAGATAPYDGWDGCNVWISGDGGTNWFVINPTTPAYNCQSMYSFGYEWGMGENIAGWGGTSGGWVDTEFDLSAAAGYSDVKIRFAFCSDPAYCTFDDPDLFGMIVDDISIDDGVVNYLENDADGIAFPAEFTLDGGDTSGDWWIVDDATYHTPSHCATCVIENHYNLSNAIESPWISIPEGFTTHFTFWVWCDMQDYSSGGGTNLEDYYMVEVSQDGIIWEYETYGFYDYGDVGRPGGASVGWEEYLPGMPFNGNISMDLTDLAGEDIKIRFRATTDDNDDGGIGTGLHFDDFTIWASSVSDSLVTFQVNMNVQEYAGNFDPGAGDIVVIRGSFNGWSGNDHECTLDDSLYTCSVNLPEGPIEYKFIIVPGAGGDDIWESCANRTYDVMSGGGVIDPVYFNDEGWDFINIEVLFRVDMEVQILNGNFNPATDWVVVRGAHESIGNWGGATQLYQETGTTIYSDWIQFDNLSTGQSIEYKYVILDDGNPDLATWEQSDNRAFEVTGFEPDNLPPPYGNGYSEIMPDVVYFADVSPDDIITQDVLVNFHVDMRPAFYKIADPFAYIVDVQTGDTVFSIDEVGVVGFFNNWPWGSISPEHILYDDGIPPDTAPDDSVYAAGVQFFTGDPKELIYKYGINGYDVEAGFAQNHAVIIDDSGPVFSIQPPDMFGEQGDWYDPWMPPPFPTWELQITATGETGTAPNEFSVVIGGDNNQNFLPAPPPPPQYMCWPQLWELPAWNGPYSEMIQVWDESNEYEWTLEIDPNGNVMPPDSRTTVLTWDPADLPDVPENWGFMITDDSGNILIPDMSLQSSLEVTGSSNTFLHVKYGQLILPFDYNLAQYWNLISLPVIPEDNSLEALFPSATVAYEFAGGTYVQADSLDNGKAYWLYVPNTETVTVEGLPFTQYSVQVDPPWEMLGSVSTPAIPAVDPGNIVVMYNFDQTYYQVPGFVMEPGFGYWVNMTGDVEEFSLNGEMLLDGLAKNEVAEADKKAASLDDWELTFALNGDDNSFNLTIGNSETAGNIPAPPAPPQYSVWGELYEADWSSGPYFSMIQPSGTDISTWLITIDPDGNANPQTFETALLSWDAESISTQGVLSLVNSNGEVVIDDMRTIESFEISGSETVHYEIVFNATLGIGSCEDAIPADYTLYQNAPNPFNPVTQIKYYLLETGKVKVTVFNIMGEEVAVLADGVQNQGFHVVNFEAANLTSGVYFYRIEAGEFTDLKKMVLIK